MMQYRVMKSTGDKLSALGFGCMRLPTKGIGIDEERAIKQIRYAIDNGVNYLDTALIYPGSEAIVGKALLDGYREKARVATKVPSAQVTKMEDLDRLLDVQLQKLQVGHIDYYLFHNLSFMAWEKLKEHGVADFITKAKADGRIKNLGFSCHAGTPEFKMIVDDYPWDFCQIQFNILDENNQAGIEGLKYAASKGLGVIIMEPLRGGDLARAPSKDVRAIWDEADVKRTPAEWALRWVWNHPEVTVVLSGMNEERHIEENLRVAGEALPGSLSDKELALVARVKEAYRKRMKVGCTGCQYCMPCPAGVNIPACFEAYNNTSLENPPVTMIKYMMRVGGGLDGNSPKGYASQCKDCGKCIKVCTQHIEIPVKLKEVRNTLEPPVARALFFAARPGINAFMKVSRWRNLRKARR